MAHLFVENKLEGGHTIQVEMPLRPFAMNYLAASGLFDKIALVDKSAGFEIRLEGADLLKAADVVGVLPRVHDPDHRCTDVNCGHPNHG